MACNDGWTPAFETQTGHTDDIHHGPRQIPHPRGNRFSYCWWTKSCTSWDGLKDCNSWCCINWCKILSLNYATTMKHKSPVFRGLTLPETNIAHENPIFPGKYHQKLWIFHGYVSFRECSCFCWINLFKLEVPCSECQMKKNGPAPFQFHPMPWIFFWLTASASPIFVVSCKT